MADRYDDFVRNRSIIHRVSIPALLSLCGRGRDVLDLGCGQGVLARELAHLGPSVMGVDASQGLLRIAKAIEGKAPLGIRYVRDDAMTLASVADESFDGVASNLVLTDLDHLEKTFLAVHRVLRPGGWFAFATLHPCFASPRGGLVQPEPEGVSFTHYFEQGRWFPTDQDRLLAHIGWNHRTLSTIVNSLIEAGFVIERLAEPGAELETALPVPPVLVIRSVWRRPS